MIVAYAAYHEGRGFLSHPPYSCWALYLHQSTQPETGSLQGPKNTDNHHSVEVCCTTLSKRFTLLHNIYLMLQGQ